LKKFFAYMLLALLVYILIYYLLIWNLRAESEMLSDYCDNLTQGQSLQRLTEEAQAAGFKTAISELANRQEQLMFVSRPEDSQASCRILLIDGRLTEKHFSLKLF